MQRKVNGKCTGLMYRFGQTGVPVECSCRGKCYKVEVLEGRTIYRNLDDTELSLQIGLC